MRAPLTALFLAASILVGAAQPTPADKLPSFNVVAACRALAAERDAIPDDMQARGIQHCIDDERTAREQLEREWSQFKPADRTICIGGSKAGSVTPVFGVDHLSRSGQLRRATRRADRSDRTLPKHEVLIRTITMPRPPSR